MKVVIVEDELAASDNLTYQLHKIAPGTQIIKVLDSVRTAVKFFSNPQEIDLVFMDIHLADGLSFEIFDQVSINTPVIFTTAYDQYALKAFKVNSIDYLLKPIDEDELTKAVAQYKDQFQEQQGISDHQVQGLLNLIKTKTKTYKTTFLANQRDQLTPLKVEKIAYFKIDTGIVKSITFDNHSYPMDLKLEDLENELDPGIFYRVNRQYIVHRDAIENIKFHFNGKLIVNVHPVCNERIMVSKAKATDFKTWMNS